MKLRTANTRRRRAAEKDRAWMFTYVWRTDRMYRRVRRRLPRAMPPAQELMMGNV